MKKLFGSLLGKKNAPSDPLTQDIDRVQETIIRLQQLVEERSFVEVRFPMKSSHAFQSLILKVDPVERYLLIDELFPANRSIMATSGDVVEITSVSRGMPVKFQTTIHSVSIDDGDGMPAYRLELPGNVSADQRRRNFRLPVEQASGVQLRIRNADGSTLLCTVLNVSHGGVGFSCQGNISERLRSETLLKNCRLRLPDNEEIKIDLEVRSFEYRRHPYRHTLVGTRIAKIEQTDERIIGQFLVGMQRQLRRETKQDDNY